MLYGYGMGSLFLGSQSGVLATDLGLLPSDQTGLRLPTYSSCESESSNFLFIEGRLVLSYPIINCITRKRGLQIKWKSTDYFKMKRHLRLQRKPI